MLPEYRCGWLVGAVSMGKTLAWLKYLASERMHEFEKDDINDLIKDLERIECELYQKR